MTETDFNDTDQTISINPAPSSGNKYELIPKKDIDEVFEIYQDRKVTNFKEYKTLDGFLEKLQVMKEVGLDVHDQSDLKLRRSMYSVIEETEEKQTSIIDYIMNALEDLMLRLLILVAMVSILLGIAQYGWKSGWIEGASILISVVIVVSIQSYTDYKKSKQFAVLHQIQSVLEHETKRNGHISLINVKEWVVGDIIQITPGCIPKADGILITCDIPVQADESSLTGENEIQIKEVGSCVFEGCPIVDGYGEMVILRLGKDSCQGRIKSCLADNEDETTPLQDKLEVMANQIGVLALYAAVLTFATLMGFQIYTTYVKDECFHCVDFYQDVVRFLMVGFGIIIMAIPEGLPLSVTIALAYSVHQMYLDNNLVKKLKSCETMGGVSDICTDKTGTLTYGKMQLKKVLLNFNALPLESLSSNTSQTKDLLLRIIQNSSKAIVDQTEDGLDFEKGNITEIALIKWVMQQQHPRSYYNEQKIREFPFTSKNRCSGTIVNCQGTSYLYIKGQPDSVLPNCVSIYFNDEIIELTEESKQKILSQIDEYSKLAYRGLVFAVKKLEGNEYSREAFSEEQMIKLMKSNDLTFVSTCFLQDELRVEVPQAVKQLRAAGVTTRMITGDAYGTAKAIAIDSGIILEGEEDAIITGYELSQMPDDVLNERACSIKVVAKCNPEQKYKFVKALKSQDKLVAVTGDGTNDVPSFQVSDVCFTMGKNGTEIIKDAGDIILLDDNFASIVTACLWGRNIQEGIRKFLVFQLTVNIVGVFVSFVGSIIFRESPLSSSQMLWINLIMDTFASLALATDHPTPDLLTRLPYGRNEDLISGYMKRNIVFQCLYQIIALSFVLAFADNIFGIPEFKHQDQDEYQVVAAVHNTIFFHTFVLLQLINEFNCRDLRRDILNPFKNLFRNNYFLTIMVVSFGIQYSLVEFGGQTFGCAPLSLNQHLFCLLLGAGGLIVGFIAKIIPESFYDKTTLFRDPVQARISKLQQGIQADAPYQVVEDEEKSIKKEHIN